jgi:HAD superfamily hydrolase (TIGR01509 family)
VKNENNERPAVCGVALDMDGLMFDTERLYHHSTDTLLIRRGHRYEDAVRRQMMGQPGPKAIQILIDYYGLTESMRDVLDEADEIFAGFLADDLRPMPGLFELLDLLESLQIPFGTATSSRREFAHEILQRGGVLQRMQFVLSGDDVRNGKPDPEIYLAAAKKMEIWPETMLVLEDSGNGALAAVTASAQTIAVPGEHSQDHDFTGCVMIAESLADHHLLQYIQRGAKTAGFSA